MMRIETALKNLETFLMWDIGAFAVLLGFILLRIRRAGYDPVSSYSRGRLSLGVDVRFLTQLGKRYSKAFDSKIIKTAYDITLWVGVIGFSVNFILAVISAIGH